MGEDNIGIVVVVVGRYCQRLTTYGAVASRIVLRPPTGDKKVEKFGRRNNILVVVENMCEHNERGHSYRTDGTYDTSDRFDL